MIRHVARLLAARAAARQVEAVVRADAAAEAADLAVRRVWRALLDLLRRPGLSWAHMQTSARVLFGGLAPGVLSALGDALGRLARWGHRTAARGVLDSVPVRLLAVAAAGKIGGVGTPIRAAQLGELRSPGWRRPDLRALLESPTLTLADLLRPLREPAGTPDQLRQLFASLLFPPPAADLIRRVVYGGDWMGRLAAATRLAAPEALASRVAAGLAAGRGPREIARDLLPLVDGVRASARRVARTEAMRVAGEMQIECHRQLGSLVIGYQVHATLDQHTRPWHAARSGQVYYFNPPPGQKGMRQCPHPPDEPEDPAERPAGTLRTAWNCRCYLTPVLRGPYGASQISETAGGKLVPDPAVYGEWFDRADGRRRRLAVGTRRYQAVVERMPGGGEGAGQPRPEWAAFLDPDSGDLMPLAALRAESPAARATRVAQVQAMLAERRRLTADVLRQGFLPGVR